MVSHCLGWKGKDHFHFEDADGNRYNATGNIAKSKESSELIWHLEIDSRKVSVTTTQANGISATTTKTTPTPKTTTKD